MMSIGEYAGRTGLSVSAVRFYDQRGLLAPAEVDRSTGYRLYHPDQVVTGRLLSDLRRMDMPLRQIQLVLAADADQRWQLVDDHLRSLEDVLHRAHSIAQDLGLWPTNEEYPMSSTPVSSTTLRSHDLAQALDHVLPTAGIDPERPNLMCVLIEAKDTSLRLVTTDSYRLAVRDLVPLDMGDEFSAVVAAVTLERWRPHLNGDVDLALGIEGNKVTAAGADVVLDCRVVPIRFPDYEEVMMEAEARSKAIVDRRRILDGLHRFDGDEAVLLSWQGGGVQLERSDLTVEIDADGTGPDAQVALNPRFGADGVRHAVGAEVVIEFDSPTRPVVFRSADDGTCTSMVMPVHPDDLVG